MVTSAHGLRLDLVRLLLLAAATGACASVAGGCSGMRPGNVRAVAPTSAPANPRVGNAYLVRGFIGVFSTGIDDLSSQIRDSGVSAIAFQDDQWMSLAASIRRQYREVPNHEPIVLIGHSYGADDVIRIARELKRDDIQVDLLVTLDPVTPPQIPTNVKRCVNVYQSNGVWDRLPWLRGVRVEKPQGSATEIANFDIRVDRTDLLEPGVDHFNIEKKPKVHREVINHVLAACPTRSQWALRSQGRPAVGTPETNEALVVKRSPAMPQPLTTPKPAVISAFSKPPEVSTTAAPPPAAPAEAKRVSATIAPSAAGGRSASRAD